MRPIVRWLAALGVLGLAGWYGGRSLLGTDVSPGPAAMAKAQTPALPLSPQSWRGRIDYRALDRQFAAMAMRPEMAGLAVAVVEDGDLRFIGTYGVAERESGAPVTPRTQFRWASVSKTVTGLLAAALAEEGTLDMEKPVAAWPNSLRLPGGAEASLTLAQLLSHQTGLTKNAYDEKLEEGNPPDRLRASLATAPLQCVPTTCHSYQNVAFDAASEILTAAAGMSFEDKINERFFGPLGMASARYGRVGLTGIADWARPYGLTGVRPLRDAYWRVPAAAGVSSNIVDFARWLQAAMGRQPRILAVPVLARALAPRVATHGLYAGALRRATSMPGYGLGWRSFSYDGHRLYGHSGAVDGYRATLLFEPETKTGIVAMWNSNWGVPFRIPFAVFDSLHRRSDSRWLDLSDVPLPSAAVTSATPPNAGEIAARP